MRAVLILVAAVLAGGCDAAGADGFIVVDPWVRAAVLAGSADAPHAAPVNGAAYLVLRNRGTEADAVVDVETEAADAAELHTVTLDDGIMRMRAVDSVPVPPRAEAVFEPGGPHIMLVGIRQALAAGDTVDLTLRLRSGAAVDVRAPVRVSGSP